MQGSRQALSILNEYGKSMPGVWIRLALVLLMMTVGFVGVKAQNTDYSGTYCLANNNQGNFLGNGNDGNFYLCPSHEYYDNGSVSTTENGTPFFTTYQTKQDAKSLWVFEKVDGQNYYTIKLYGTNKYITVNDALTGGYKAHRRRIHLEELAELSDRNYFEITPIHVIDGVSGVSISCLEKYKSGNNKYFNPAGGNQPSYTSTNNKETPWSGGMVGFYTIGKTSGDDRGSVWFLEVPKPIINIDDNFKLTFTCANEDLTIHYTIDDGEPSATGTDDIYNATEIQLTEGVHTIKAIAVMNSGNTGYASGVATYVVNVLSNNTSYLIQSVECTDFYMMPGDVDNGNTTVNTSSLFRSTMAWTFSYAGCENGFLYYYIKNGENYLYHTSNGSVYMKANDDFSDSDDGYKFSIVQGYSDDNKTNPDGFHIVPKAKISDNTYCIYKGGWVKDKTLANSTAEAMKGSNNARRPEHNHTRWNIIPYSATGNVLSSSLVTSDDDNPILFKIENVGTAGQYMSAPATETEYVGTATLGNDVLAWYIKEASSDNERKYYYIIHKNTGNYLKFNKPIVSPVTSMESETNVLDLYEYNVTESDRYQFVFAKSTIDGAYYIVPKGLENVSQKYYYALYLDGTNPIKSNNQRENNSYQWKFVPFCANPVFVESGEDITLTCATTGAEIHYTDDGTEPDENSATYSTSWNSSDQLCIKAIAVIKEGSNVVSTSEVVTLLNRPVVTLNSKTFTYNGMIQTPTVNSVSVNTTSAPKNPETYRITYSNSNSNNSNAGNFTVTIDDSDEDDRWYIWNVPETNFTIDKKMLTVTADNKTVEHGSPAPEYSVTITGFVNAEGLDVLNSIPTATSEYTMDSDVGSNFDIIPSGGVDENYDFFYVNGTLTVAAAFVTLTANSGTVTYSGTEQTVTGFTCSVDGLTFTGVSASGSGTDAGTYDVTFTGVTLNSTTDNTGQYVVTQIEDGTLTINPAAVTVTADDKTKTYGEADPALSATVTGLVNSESESLISYTLSRATGNNAGTYTITPSGEATQGNYTVSYVPGTFTINTKALTITANNHSIEYSNAPSNDGVTYSGFIEGENENTQGVFTGTLVYSYNSQADGKGTSYTTTIPKGTFYIIPGGLTATNYNITYNNGTLTVTEKSIGDGAIAPGFTLEFGNEGAIILKDGETQLIQTTDFTIGDETISPSGKYSSKTVSGTGNYTGSFSIRNAIVNFQTDDNQVEWSATFVAEKSGDTDIGHALPEGVRAYIITNIIDGWAIPEQLDYIPEGIPVLLISNKESGGFLVENANPDDVTLITREGSGNQKDANMLEMVKTGMAGYVTDSESPNYQKAHFNVKTIYLLNNYNEFVFNMDGYLSDGKVFLNPIHPSDPSSASPSHAPMRLGINWDIVNGIKEIPDKGKDEKRNSGQWYGLDGRQLNGIPTRKGLYFHDGKKVIIKEDL